jgi:hypothetical protein
VLSKLFREFSGFFWNLFSFSLSYFYLLECSKIFFMSSKYFIGLFILQSTFGNFPGIFVIFWVFFVPLNFFWAFPEFVFALKNILKKNKSYPPGLGRARRTDPHPLRPSLACQSPSADEANGRRRSSRPGRACPGQARPPRPL